MMQSMEQRGSADEHLDMAVAAGHIGIWELDTVTGKAWRNLTHDRIFGYETLRDSWTFDDFLDHIVEEDRGSHPEHERKGEELEGQGEELEG